MSIAQKKILSAIAMAALVLCIVPMVASAQETAGTGEAGAASGLVAGAPEGPAEGTSSAEPAQRPAPTQRLSTAGADETLVDPNATLLDSGTFGEGGALTWEYYDDATLKVYGIGAMPDFESTTQPWNARLTAIEHIEVCDGVTSVGDYAFANCWYVNKVKLPQGLTRIGAHALSGSSRLKSLIMPDSVTVIGTYVLAQSGVETCHLSTSLTAIPDYAFSESALSDVNMFEGIESIGEGAFRQSHLDQITIPNTVTALGQAAYAKVKTSKSFTIPGGITSIPANAFTEITIDGTITVAEGVSLIAANAFSYTSASCVTLPASLQTVSCDAFWFAGIGEFVVDEANESYASANGALYSRFHISGTTITDTYDSKTAVLRYLPVADGATSAAVPEGPVDANPDAFRIMSYRTIASLSVSSTLVKGLETAMWSLENLREVSVGNGNSAYAASSGVLYSADMKRLLGCPKGYRGALVMPSTVETIAGSACENCVSITEIVISPNVETIPRRAFYSCYGVVNCRIPSNVTSIAEYAFSLTPYSFNPRVFSNVYYGGTAEQWAALRNASTGQYNNQPLLLPDLNVVCDVDDYGMCDDGLSYCLLADGTLCVQANRAVQGEDERNMRDYGEGNAPWLAYGNTVKVLELDDSVATVGAGAFRGLGALEKVVVPTSVTAVGAGAFGSCDSLVDVVCAGDPFEVVPADAASSSSPSFDASEVTLHYIASNENWTSSAAYDAVARTWNGYAVCDDAVSWLPEVQIPQLTQVSLEVGSVHVTGDPSNQWLKYYDALSILDENGDDMSRSVSVEIASPTRTYPIESSYATLIQGESEGDAYYAMAEALYNVKMRRVEIGRCVLAGAYTVTVSPIEGKSTGEPQSVSFSVTRDPERYSAGIGAFVNTYRQIGRRSAQTLCFSQHLPVINQYVEDVSRDYTMHVTDMLSGQEVTDRLSDYDMWIDGNDICVGRMAPSRSFSITYERTSDGTIASGSTLFCPSRDSNVMNVPYSLSLSGGEETITVQEGSVSDTWASVPYRTHVLDAFDDPCWPDVAWRVLKGETDISERFSVDAQGYLSVKPSAIALLGDGDNFFTVEASVYDSYAKKWLHATLPLTIRKAPAYVAPVTHLATFMAGDDVVAQVTFTEGDEALDEPTVPARDNYLGVWEAYDLASATGDITVNAVYSPIDPDAVSEIGGGADAVYDGGEITINLTATAATRVVKVASSRTKPVDVVLVCDQSGSMTDKLGASGQSKRDALVQCANRFVSQLQENALATGADHRVALVGFAYSAYNGGAYRNTGLLATGSSTGGAKGFSSLGRADYASALLSVSVNGAINPAITAGIDSIVAEGATAADVGLKIAKNVFSENPVGTAEDGTAARERIVVFITDGVPTCWGEDATLVSQTAAEAISMANGLKQGQGARIYSVGVEAAADPSAEFTSSANGVLLDGRGKYASFDFNRFLHAVSSNYPQASGMGNMGEGLRDAGFYMAVTDTSNLGRIFTSILYSTVYEVGSFDRATLSYTLPSGLVMTMKQEQEMREALIARGMTDDDIVVETLEGGLQRLAFANVKVEPTVEGGVERYVASVSFKVSAANGVEGVVAAGENASVQVGDSHEISLEVPTVEVPAERCVLVFMVNDAVYEIRDAAMGDLIEIPDTDLARWMGLEQQVDSTVSSSYAVFRTTTLTRTYQIRWVAGDSEWTRSYEPGSAVVVPDEVAAAAPAGFELVGFTPALPATMPARNMTCTAVFAPIHEHSYLASTYKTGSCDEGIVTHYVCLCGEERTEQAAPKPHSYEAVLSNSGMYGTTVEKLVCKDCGHSVDKHVTYQVSTSSLGFTVLDLSSYAADVEQVGASDDQIAMRFYVGGSPGRIYTVTRIDAGGTKTTYQTRLQDGYLVFDPDHFSVYVIDDRAEGSGGQQATALSYEQALDALANPELPVVEGLPEGSGKETGGEQGGESGGEQGSEGSSNTPGVDGKDSADKVDSGANTDAGSSAGKKEEASRETHAAQSAAKTIVAVPKGKSLVYKGKRQVGVAPTKAYSVTGGAATKAGTYKAKVVLKAGYAWPGGSTTTKYVAFTIAKAKNTLSVSKATKTVKATALLDRGKAVAPLKAKKAQGKLSYKKLSGSKRLSVNKKTGKVTVKMGTKKGTYKARIKVSAAGNANYKSASKIVTITVRVK